MDRTRLKERIQDLAASVKNVRHENLITLLENHVKSLCTEAGLPYDYRIKGSHHVFTIGLRTFVLVKPHGTSFVKPVYVRSFLEAMEAIELYEEK